MGRERTHGRGSSGTVWAVNETKHGKLSVRRLLHEASYPEVQRLSKILDDSGEIVRKGMLYVPRYVRLTLIGTEELPYGKKHRTADIVSRVPSCADNLNVRLGGFMLAKSGSDKPKLAVQVLSGRVSEEIEELKQAFGAKDLQLRGDIVEGVRTPHVSLAEIDRDAESYFTYEKLMQINELAGATISEAGVYLGSITLRAVSLPVS